jgi:2-amino-4-hydroxy-6-hydroxymethyldihydropteridine diphosphokinase
LLEFCAGASALKSLVVTRFSHWQGFIAGGGSLKKTVYLSLGSNLGDRAKNLEEATAALRKAAINVTRISSTYETEPVDFTDQPWFLNIVLEAETELAPPALLQTLRGIEMKMGSRKLIAKGPRLIDMDILLYANEVIDAPELQIPHPRIHLRRFVLEPLAQIAPGVRHPILNMTAAEMLASTPDKSAVRIVSGF